MQNIWDDDCIGNRLQWSRTRSINFRNRVISREWSLQSRTWRSSKMTSWNGCKISEMMTALKTNCSVLERDLERYQQMSKIEPFRESEICSHEREDFQKWSHEMDAKYLKWWLHWKQIAMISNEINRFSKSSHFERMKFAATNVKIFKNDLMKWMQNIWDDDCIESRLQWFRTKSIDFRNRVISREWNLQPRTWKSPRMISWNECRISEMMTALKANCNDFDSANKFLLSENVNSAKCKITKLEIRSIRLSNWILIFESVSCSRSGRIRISKQKKSDLDEDIRLRTRMKKSNLAKEVSPICSWRN